MRILLSLPLAILTAVLTTAAGTTLEPIRDLSCRISLVNLIDIASFDTSDEGWIPFEGCEATVSDGSTLDYTGDGEGSDAKFKEGASSLLITTPEALPASRWRSQVQACDGSVSFSAGPPARGQRVGEMRPGKRP